MATAGENKKRKGPPNFHHLPINRAKKLKKAWVEKAKIKSQWKAQKRKEGLLTALERQRPPHVHDEADATDESGPLEDSDSGNEDLEDGEQTHNHENVQDSVKNPRSLETSAVPKNTNPAKHATRERRTWQERITAADDDKNDRANNKEMKAPDSEQPSLRDLTRQAYSRSSLHTYKSDPLKRRRGASGSTAVSRRGSNLDQGSGDRGGRGGRGGRGDQGRGGIRASGVDRRRGEGGGGQPNMKLRMDAMLEKIKRDYVH